MSVREDLLECVLLLLRHDRRHAADQLVPPAWRLSTSGHARASVYTVDTAGPAFRQETTWARLDLTQFGDSMVFQVNSTTTLSIY